MVGSKSKVTFTAPRNCAGSSFVSFTGAVAANSAAGNSQTMKIVSARKEIPNAPAVFVVNMVVTISE